MTGDNIRRLFLEYFEKHGHKIVRSSSLVPADDPTLLFTNAGMVQFKRVFLGEEKRDYRRATTSQKCVRAGGKHNDLENVGYTARHHTFFEMLGNFSFGDYFKEDAVAFAWDLLTNGYGLPADKLWASVYFEDDEAYTLWHEKIGIPGDRIVRLGEEDNFWAMGDTGPCGPCSEIHLDRGAAHGCGSPDCGVDCDCDRFLEIWNLVFMQFNRDSSGKMTPLPKPSIDTGMGLERLASVLQDVDTNFDTDLIRPIITTCEDLAQRSFGQDQQVDVAMKVIADHSRAAAFLIGDGVLPSNEGRGYVLRRIMRRAIRYGRNIGLNRPFLHRTARTVFEIMRPAYPELSDAAAFITNVIQNEEQRFMETLDHGLKLLNDALAEMEIKGQTKVDGGLIFKLYDTYGFPVDIVQDVVRDKGLKLDLAGFQKLMEKQRARSRSKTDFESISEAYKQLASQGIKPEFSGYGRLEDKSEVLLIVQDGRAVDQVNQGEQAEIVVARTPFYAESGGQVGDKGTIEAEGLKIEVVDTVKDPTGLVIHHGLVTKGTLSKGQVVTLKVDAAKRKATALNHTATHILHSVLRQVLGDHVKQAGSLVSAERLRFDFTHFAQVERKTLHEIEKLVNARIRENVPVRVNEMDMESAIAQGATALFEEKYGDRVRVVALADFSRELCGGTHTERTGDIGFFKILSESSVASGIRRIEAVTGQGALAAVQATEDVILQASRLLREKPAAVVARIEQLISGYKAAEKQLERLKAELAEAKAAGTNDAVREINGVTAMVQRVDADSPAALRDLADKFRDRLKSGVVVLGSSVDAKAFLVAMATKNVAGKIHAGKIVKEIAPLVGGGGGGRPDMAQAGGSRPENLDQALAKAWEIITSMTAEEK